MLNFDDDVYKFGQLKDYKKVKEFYTNGFISHRFN